MTTRQEKLSAINEAIQKAVPELVMTNLYHTCGKLNCQCKKEDLEERTKYADVGIREILLCLNTKSKDEDDYIIMSTDGWFSIVKSDNENDNMLSVAQYNLHKDRIEDQDDELIDFLFTFTQS